MSNKDKIKINRQQLKKAEKCESLDEGTFAFLNWMNCKSFIGESYDNSPPLILKYINFPQVTVVKLFDSYLGREIFVDIIDCVPLCKNCITDDCSHVGFTICLLQLIEREGYESMDDIIK
jgi:hypothetical protein